MKQPTENLGDKGASCDDLKSKLEMQEKCPVSKKSDFIPQGYPQDNSTEESQPH